MTSRQYILYIIPALIWGSTWFAIKYQLGNVDPMVSVAYRFLLAGALLFSFCLIKKKRLKFSLKEHLLMMLLGFSLFGINYWFVYQAEIKLTSGVVAVIFSLVIFFTLIFNVLLLKGQFKKDIVLAGILGFTGTAFLFKNEFQNVNLSPADYVILLFCLGGLISASLGNILSAYKQKRNIPVLQANAFGMIYGGTIMFIATLLFGKPIMFDYSTGYIISLFYLAIFGSVVAFSTYLKLLGEIGPDRSIYIALITPAIALMFSTVFEGYSWDLFAFTGIILLFAGNVLVLKIKKKKQLNENIYKPGTTKVD